MEHTARMTPQQVRELYRDVLEIPELAPALSAYQKAELKKMADGGILEALRFANEFFPLNPAHQYPPQYVGREVLYWQEVGHGSGADATRMRKILAAPTDSQPEEAGTPADEVRPLWEIWKGNAKEMNDTLAEFKHLKSKREVAELSYVLAKRGWIAFRATMAENARLVFGSFGLDAAKNDGSTYFNSTEPSRHYMDSLNLNKIPHRQNP